MWQVNVYLFPRSYLVSLCYKFLYHWKTYILGWMFSRIGHRLRCDWAADPAEWNREGGSLRRSERRICSVRKPRGRWWRRFLRQISDIRWVLAICSHSRHWMVLQVASFHVLDALRFKFTPVIAFFRNSTRVRWKKDGTTNPRTNPLKAIRDCI